MTRLLLILIAFPLLVGFSPVTGPTDLGNDAYEKGHYEEALKHYKDAAQGRTDSPEAHYNLGNAYYKLGQYEKALEEYGKAAKLDPAMADAYYNAGDSLFRMKMYPDALKSYGRAKERYESSDPDTEHNIELTRKLIEQERQKQQKQSGKDKDEGQLGGQQKPSGGSGKDEQAGDKGQAGRRQAGHPPMSNEELKALLERQANEEKRLRNYFRPGDKKDGRDRENEIEQMLRGMGFGPMQREGRPGEPYVERDW